MEDMKVAEIEYSKGFIDHSTKEESSDWKLIQEISSFSHESACEFIVFIGTEETQHQDRLEWFQNNGMSFQFLKEVELAQKAGFYYACFYA